MEEEGEGGEDERENGEEIRRRREKDKRVVKRVLRNAICLHRTKRERNIRGFKRSFF